MINILHLEDNEFDAEIIQREILVEIPDCKFTVSKSKDSFISNLDSGNVDLIISDYSLPGFDGISALSIVRNNFPQIPFIFVSGHIGEDLAIEALRKGATDYVLKDKLNKLLPVIKRTLDEKREVEKREEAERSQKEIESSFWGLFNSVSDGIFVQEKDGTFIDINSGALKMYGYDKDFIIGKKPIAISAPGKNHFDLLNDLLEKAFYGEPQLFEFWGKRMNNEIFPQEIRLNKGSYFGKDVVVAIARDISERKLAEESLRKSEERFRGIYNSSLLGIATVDSNGAILRTNKAFQEFLEFTEEDIKGRNIIELTFPDDRRVSKKYLQAVTDNIVDSFQLEKRFVTKNNQIKWAHISASSVRDENGDLEYAIGLFEDITAQKLAEENLHESENRVSTLVNNLQIVLYAIDLKGKFKFVIGKGLESIGRDSSVLLNKSVFEYENMILLKDALDNKVSLKDALDKGISGNTLSLIAKVEGRYYDNRIIPWQNISGDIIGLLGFALDISNQINDSKALKKSERKFKELTDLLPQTIFELDSFNHILFLNKEGISAFKIQGQLDKNKLKFDELIHEDDHKRLASFFRRIKDGELINEMDFIAKRSNGTSFPCLIFASKMLDEDGRIGIRGILVDDTDRKKVLEELIVAKNKAEESDRLKSEFLAQMSHEIRTPLNVILSYNSLLEDELKDKVKPERVSIFNSMDSAGKRLLRTIDLILNVSMAQTGLVDVHIERVNLDEITTQLLSEFRSVASSRNIDLRYNNSIKNSIIESDNYIISQILQNLIDNAIKYTHEGHVEIKIYEISDRVYIDIIDTGIGIASNYLPNLFSPFSQEEGGYSRKFEGNGLGLALVKNYADLIDANISVQSSKGVGSTFTISFRKSKKPIRN